MLETIELLLIMPKHQLRARVLHNALDHLMRTHPIIVIPRQPALRHVVLVVLVHVVLVGGEEPGTAVREIQLQHCQAGGVAWRVLQVNSRGEFPEVAVESFPVYVHGEVLWARMTVSGGFGDRGMW